MRLILAVVSIIVAICGVAYSTHVNREIQTIREQQQLSQIGYAIMVQPAPVPGESIDTTGRWRVIIEVFNSGPVDAKTILLTLQTPPPAAFLHSPPMIMSDAGAAKVDIKTRDPDGIYQVEITNLIKGDELMLKMLYQVPDDHKKDFMDRWKQGGIFDAAFGKRFIPHFFFSGEHLAVSNFGMMPMKADFSDPIK